MNVLRICGGASIPEPTGYYLVFDRDKILSRDFNTGKWPTKDLNVNYVLISFMSTKEKSRNSTREGNFTFGTQFDKSLL